MKKLVFALVSFFVVIAFAQGTKPSSAKPLAKGTVSAPPLDVSRELATKYLALTGRTGAMEKMYRARFIEAKGAKPVSEAMKKKHVAALDEMLVKLVQASFTRASLEAVVTFLKTPAGERWSEEANSFNEDFRDESSELLGGFAEEIKEANDEAEAEAREAKR